MHYNERIIRISKPLLGDEESKAVNDVLRSGLLAQGEKTQEFERSFAEYIGTRSAVATNSGTSALHTALASIGTEAGDEIITTAFSFMATASSILMQNARPVFCDIDPETFNILPDQIEQKITGKTKAIILVHLYGQPCDMERILKVAEVHKLYLIEDCAQAHGAEYKGKKVGSFGIGCFSFYPTKNMTTGEGGMITSNDEGIIEKARMIINHGQAQQYVHDILGYNYRMTDVSAAIGICQLRKLEEFNRKRIENAKTLTQGLKGIKGPILPHVKPGIRHVFHQYTVRVTGDFDLSRDELRQSLLGKGIQTGIYYPIPINKQPLLRKLGYNDCLPNSERLAQEVLSLPVHPGLTGDDVEYIIESVLSC